MDCRLIIDPPRNGAWNMAVDEALLLSAGRAGQGRATLRFYQWEEPTLSLGYFQSHSDRVSHAASRNCPLVRRSTGGGAILHDRELTYSFTAPASSHLGIGLQDYYTLFHMTLVEQLEDWGIKAVMFDAAQSKRSSEPPFLCFQRRAQGDVLVAGSKICGSAQRRHRGALLQHGSVLLERSPAAPELPGIKDLTKQSISAGRLADSWQTRLEERLGWRFSLSGLRDDTQEAARSIMMAKFSGMAWTRRR